MNLPITTLGYYADGDIPSYSLVIRSATVDGAVEPGADGTKLLLGVTTIVSVINGQPVDVIRAGFADVRYGGTVAADDPLTADAKGNAIKAAAGDFIIGYAEDAGDEGDIGSVWIVPGKLA